MHNLRRLAGLLWALFLGTPGVCLAETSPEPTISERLFLDRLMAAEFGGRLTAKNSATSAYGPFQFLSTTFLDVVQRNFPQLAAGKSNAEILELRADAEISRKAALAYTRENASFLAARNTAITAANLRLAFFAGPSGAVKIVAARPEEPVSNILSGAALEANPFLGRMTAGELVEKASREVEGVGTAFGAAVPREAQARAGAAIAVRCNLKLASCRKWLALAQKRMGVTKVSLSSRLAAP